MPVVVVSAYDENGMPNAMTAARVMIKDRDKNALFMDLDHTPVNPITQ